MWLYTFVFDHHITLLVCGVLVGNKRPIRQQRSPTNPHKTQSKAHAEHWPRTNLELQGSRMGNLERRNK